MKVENMESSRGNKVANQFIIHNDGTTYFQSYGVIIVKIEDGKVYLDSLYWDYSKTTGTYSNQFLEETKTETEKKIRMGEYILTNLN